MGLTKGAIPREVEAVIVYPYLFEHDEGGNVVTDETTGKPKLQRLVYTFAVQRKADADLDELEKQLGQGRKLSNVERLAKLLTKEPQGFEDFPCDGRPLEERVKEYFGTEDMQDFVEDALTARMNAVYPSQLFRGL